MVTYCEEFLILDRRIGIEHHGDKFHVWHGGCGVGSYDTIQAARRHIHARALVDLRAGRTTAEAIVRRNTETLETLGDDPFNLGEFKVKPDAQRQ